MITFYFGIAEYYEMNEHYFKSIINHANDDVSSNFNQIKGSQLGEFCP